MSDQLNTTPPESFYETPITPRLKKPPSQVQSIVHFLDSQRTASSRTTSNTRNVFRLAREALDELFKTVQFNAPLWAYFQDKVRYIYSVVHRLLPASTDICMLNKYDYFIQVERFVLRMPSNVHEFCGSSFVSEIDSQLRHYQASGDPSSQAFAKDVWSNGSGDLELPSDDDGHIDKHTPDGNFWHRQATWPGVVMEAPFSNHYKI